MVRGKDLSKVLPCKYSELMKCSRSTSIEDKKKNQQAYDFLCDNIDLLLSHSNEIIKKKEFYFCSIQCASINIAYIDQAGSLIPIGVLLTLWDDSLCFFSSKLSVFSFFVRSKQS